MAQETQTGTPINLEGWDGEVDEGGFKREGNMYTYGLFMLRFDRKQHNSVKKNLSIKKKKKQRHHFADKGPYSHSYGFSSSHVQI